MALKIGRSVELLNTAIEAVVNLVVGEKRHPLTKAAKDMGSAQCYSDLFRLPVFGAMY